MYRKNFNPTYILVFIALGSILISAMKSTNYKTEPIPNDVEKLLEKNKCLSCHTPYRRLVGPSFVNIAKKQYDAKRIATLLEKPEPANWPGYPAMAPIKNIPYKEVCKITDWINSLKL